MHQNQKHNRSRNSLIHWRADQDKAALLILGGK